MLRVKGVEVLLGAPLAAVEDWGVRLVDGREIATRTVVWTAGVKVSPLAALVPGDLQQSHFPSSPTLRSRADTTRQAGGGGGDAGRDRLAR